MWILISWLLMKPADLDLHSFQKKGIEFCNSDVHSGLIRLSMVLDSLLFVAYCKLGLVPVTKLMLILSVFVILSFISRIIEHLHVLRQKTPPPPKKK